MNKKLKLSILILIFLLSFFNIVHAFDGNELSNIRTVASTKVWTIRFNHKLPLNIELSKDSVSVVDSKGNTVDVSFNIGDTKDTLTVYPPKSGYKTGENYTLKVNLPNLREPSIVNFLVKDTADINSNSDLNNAIKKVAENSKSVVFIEMLDSESMPMGTASGFIIEPNGKIITNYHVIADATSLRVTLEDGTKYDVEGVYDCSKSQDIAVLKLKNAANLPAVKLGDSNNLYIADDVITIGSPVGYKNTVTSGIISGLNRENESRKGKDIQITAPIAPGSSGGALFNIKGEVIGITYSGMDIGNVGFAIPINEVKPYLNSTKVITLKEAVLREKYSMFRNDNMLSFPSNVTANRVSVNEAKVKWDKVPDADYYRVYISEPFSNLNQYTGTYTIPKEFMGDMPLIEYKNSSGINKWIWKEGDCLSIYTSDNAKYYLKVTAVRGNIESEFSDTVEVDPYKAEILESNYNTYEEYLVNKFSELKFKDSSALIDSYTVSYGSNEINLDIDIKGIDNFDILSSNLLSFDFNSEETSEKINQSKSDIYDQLDTITKEVSSKYPNKKITSRLVCDFESHVYFPLTKQKVHYDAESDQWVMNVVLLSCSRESNKFDVNWLLDKQ